MWNMEDAQNGMEDLKNSSSSSLFHLTAKLTQTKTANENNGRKIGNGDKTIYVETCFS